MPIVALHATPTGPTVSPGHGPPSSAGGSGPSTTSFSQLMDAAAPSTPAPQAPDPAPLPPPAPASSGASNGAPGHASPASDAKGSVADKPSQQDNQAPNSPSNGQAQGPASGSANGSGASGTGAATTDSSASSGGANKDSKDDSASAGGADLAAAVTSGNVPATGDPNGTTAPAATQAPAQTVVAAVIPPAPVAPVTPAPPAIDGATVGPATLGVGAAQNGATAVTTATTGAGPGSAFGTSAAVGDDQSAAAGSAPSAFGALVEGLSAGPQKPGNGGTSPNQKSDAPTSATAPNVGGAATADAALQTTPANGDTAVPGAANAAAAAANAASSGIRADATSQPHGGNPRGNVAETSDDKSAASSSLPAHGLSLMPTADPTQSAALQAAGAPGVTAATPAGGASPAAQSMPGAQAAMVAPLVPIAGVAIELAARAQLGSNRFEIRLDPPELGRIDVRLDVDKQGNVTSHLVVERSQTLAMLRNDAPQLARALQDAGLKTTTDGLQFSLSDQGAGAQNQSFQNGSTPNSRLVIPIDDISIPVETARSYGRLVGASGGLDIRV